MGNSRLYFHVAITLTHLCLGGTRLIGKPKREQFSDHWARCEAILKQSETRACTQSGGPSCTGRRVSEPDEDVPGYWCNADSCPTVLSSLEATVYREDLLRTRPGLWWYGVNISWTINATGTTQDTEKKTFLIAAHIAGYGRTYFAEIDATLNETDYVNGEATLHYDCIYPISPNQSYTFNINVKSKPHARGDFQFTTVETIPSVLATSTTRPVQTAYTTARDRGRHHDTSGIGDVTSTENLSETSVPPGNDKKDPAGRHVHIQNPGLLYGLFGGLLGVAVMCASIFAAHKHWIRQQKHDRLQKVVILAMNDDAMMNTRNKDFRRRLRRSFQCRIVKLHDMSLDTVVQPYDLIKAEMTSAACIIVVTSQRLLDVLARLEMSRDSGQKSRDPSRIALEIIHRDLRLSPTHMSKIVSVQFKGSHIGLSTPFLSPWRCVSLPGNTDKLVKFLKGDRDALKADQTDTMGDTGEPNVDSGVQFPDDQSSISSAAKMDVPSWSVPDGPYAQQNLLYNQHVHMEDAACMPSVDVVHNGCVHHHNVPNALSGPQTISWKPPVIPLEQSEIGSEAIEDMVHDINSGLF